MMELYVTSGSKVKSVAQTVFPYGDTPYTSDSLWTPPPRSPFIQVHKGPVLSLLLTVRQHTRWTVAAGMSHCHAKGVLPDCSWRMQFPIRSVAQTLSSWPSEIMAMMSIAQDSGMEENFFPYQIHSIKKYSSHDSCGLFLIHNLYKQLKVISII